MRLLRRSDFPPQSTPPSNTQILKYRTIFLLQSYLFMRNKTYTTGSIVKVWRFTVGVFSMRFHFPKIKIEETFEVRGTFQGKAVRKCNICEVALLFGVFSGGFFGKPNVISATLWQPMEENWERSFGAIDK